MKASNCDKCQVCPVVGQPNIHDRSGIHTPEAPPDSRKWNHQAVQLRMHRWGGAPYTGPFVATNPSLIMYTAGGQAPSGGGLFVGFIPADHSRYRCRNGRLFLM